MGGTTPWLVILVICAVFVCESAALSGAMKVERYCENHCQQQSFRLRQLTTNNEEKEKCKDKCYAYFKKAKMMITMQGGDEANLNWEAVNLPNPCAPVFGPPFWFCWN
ncbi:unnamed protein product [Microthlaspi erraticum]|uniref:Uncharacterized protein n=1 Tax=Microthlaspi erraticum TaxID=1685480 RepID=A0A6D2IUL4_9BRAS|nr:unnamed protein product [Microthlaspi erraticum]